jgi:radical SAM enzyme (TIGR01210 family)
MGKDSISDWNAAGPDTTQVNYTFHKGSDDHLPAQMWFQRSHEGLILFVVFYAQSCRWGRCLGCGLPAQVSSGHVPCEALLAQIDYLFRHPEVTSRRDAIRKVIVSNNGSILDEQTFARNALEYLLVELDRNFPKLATLAMETRPEYVGPVELDFISSILAQIGSSMQLEIALGFEAFADRIRNDVYNKGLTLAAFERLVRLTAPFGFRLKCYFMQKPVPGMTDAEAIADIRRAIDYLSGISEEFESKINVHVNPTYVAAGSMLERAFRQRRYTPPRLRDVASAARHARGKPVSVYIGLTDEGLAVEGGSFLRPGDAQLVEQLERFNCTQDFDILEDICRDEIGPSARGRDGARRAR